MWNKNIKNPAWINGSFQDFPWSHWLCWEITSPKFQRLAPEKWPSQNEHNPLIRVFHGGGSFIFWLDFWGFSCFFFSGGDGIWLGVRLDLYDERMAGCKKFGIEGGHFSSPFPQPKPIRGLFFHWFLLLSGCIITYVRFQVCNPSTRAQKNFHCTHGSLIPLRVHLTKKA